MSRTGTHTVGRLTELPEAIAGCEDRLATGRRWVHRGAGPDRTEVTVSTSLTGVPIQSQHSAHHDQMVYEACV